MAKIAVILNTGRTEEETCYREFQTYYSHRPNIQSWESEYLVPNIQSNDRSFLEGSLRSLTHQTFQDFQVIICDRFFKSRTESLAPWLNKLKITHVDDHHLDDLFGESPFMKAGYPCPSRTRNMAYVLAEPDTRLVVHVTDMAILTPQFLEKASTWYDYGGYGMKGVRNLVCFKDGAPFINECDLYSGDREWTWEKVFGNVDYTLGWDSRSLWAHAAVMVLDHCLDINGWNEDMDGVVDSEDIDIGWRLWRHGMKLVWDKWAQLYELYDTPGDNARKVHRMKSLDKHLESFDGKLRHNSLWLDFFAKYKRGSNDLDNIEIQANRKRPDKDFIEEYLTYAQVHGPRVGKFPINNPDIFLGIDVPTFDLKELRHKYWNA